MKKYLFVILLFAFTIFLHAEEAKKDSVPLWKTGGFASLNFNQVELSNWVKGGESSISGTALLNLFANFNEGKLSWENSCDFGFGLMKLDGANTRKNEDKIDLSSKLGYKAAESFFYTALLSFKSQFVDGFNYPNDSVVISKFFAPAYLVTSIGFDWKPTDFFSIYLSPATGRFIFISDQHIADFGSYTGEPAKYDTAKVLVEHGRTFKPDFGAYLSAKFKKDLIQNINLESKLALFNNFTDKNKSNRGNISMDWTNNVIFKVNSFISANLFVQLIYDHDIKIPLYQEVNGVKTKVGDGPRLQVKEVFGLGLYYKF